VVDIWWTVFLSWSSTIVLLKMLFTSDLILAILALFLPPVPVWIKKGFWKWELLLNVVLCFFGGIPATIHAWYIIVKNPDDGIPFFDTRRGAYEIIPDINQVESQTIGSEPGTPAFSDYAGPVVGPVAGPVAAPSSTMDAGSSSSPPPYDYSKAPADIPGANNKVQYHDDAV
jgi:uncharacterized membrane protein YqaE (UPF0057 family)